MFAPSKPEFSPFRELDEFLLQERFSWEGLITVAARLGKHEEG